jgi:hypothetical protein
MIYIYTLNYIVDNNLGFVKGIVKNMVFRRFVHLLVPFIENYRYGENMIANPNYKKKSL